MYQVLPFWVHQLKSIVLALNIGWYWCRLYWWDSLYHMYTFLYLQHWKSVPHMRYDNFFFVHIYLYEYRNNYYIFYLSAFLLFIAKLKNARINQTRSCIMDMIWAISIFLFSILQYIRFCPLFLYFLSIFAQYLEFRFSSTVRTIASVMFVLDEVCVAGNANFVHLYFHRYLFYFSFRFLFIFE